MLADEDDRELHITSGTGPKLSARWAGFMGLSGPHCNSFHDSIIICSRQAASVC